MGAELKQELCVQNAEEKEALFEKLARKGTVTAWLAGVPVDASALFARHGAVWTGHRQDKTPASSAQRARSAPKGALHESATFL